MDGECKASGKRIPFLLPRGFVGRTRWCSIPTDDGFRSRLHVPQVTTQYMGEKKDALQLIGLSRMMRYDDRLDDVTRR